MQNLFCMCPFYSLFPLPSDITRTTQKYLSLCQNIFGAQLYYRDYIKRSVEGMYLHVREEGVMGEGKSDWRKSQRSYIAIGICLIHSTPFAFSYFLKQQKFIYTFDLLFSLLKTSKHAKGLWLFNICYFFSWLGLFCACSLQISATYKLNQWHREANFILFSLKCFDPLQLLCHWSPDLYNGKLLCPTQKQVNLA